MLKNFDRIYNTYLENKVELKWYDIYAKYLKKYHIKLNSKQLKWTRAYNTYSYGTLRIVSWKYLLKQTFRNTLDDKVDRTVQSRVRLIENIISFITELSATSPSSFEQLNKDHSTVPLRKIVHFSSSYINLTSKYFQI